MAEGQEFSAGKSFLELDLYGPGSMKAFIVLENDLQNFQSAADQESLRLAFFSLCVGAFISALLGWITTASMSPARLAAYVSATIVLGLASAFLGFSWHFARRARIRLLGSIASRGGAVQRYVVAQAGEPQPKPAADHLLK